MPLPIELIVGLGNPGDQYRHTRHNAGQDWVEELAHTMGATLKAEKKFFGLTGKVQIANKSVSLLIPTTFMNHSGQAVAALCRFYQIDPQAVLVVHDELDLPPGIARLKDGGGHGGHNGLKDIIKQLGNNHQFSRLRIGIGHPGHASKVTGHVLSKAPTEDQIAIHHSGNEAFKVLEGLAQGHWEESIKSLHTALASR